MTACFFRRLALAGLAAIAIAPAGARDLRVRDLDLSDAWTRPTPPAAPAGAGYLTIINTGTEPDRLLGGRSPAVKEVQVHRMVLTYGIMRMRPVEGGLVIPAGGTVTLAPGGYHIMLIGLNTPFKAGDHIPVTLNFERAGAIRVSFAVRTTPPSPVSGEAR